MVDVNTQNKTISVNVSSSGVSSNVNASGDTTMYYSNKAREWAISNRIVDGVDYSSKYYAGRANQSALNAQSFAQSAQDSYNNFQDFVTDSLNTIDNKVQEATDNIEIQKQDTIAEIQDVATTQKEEIENLSEQEQSKIVDLGIDTRADIDLSNLSSTGEKHFLNKSQITNCILEKPKYLDWTYEGGVITLKAGSKLMYPDGFNSDGSRKFSYYTTTSDIVWNSSSTTSSLRYLWASRVSNVANNFHQSMLYTGDTAPTLTNNYCLWYDTANNILKNTNDKGATWNTVGTFPFMTAYNSEGGAGFEYPQNVFDGIGIMDRCIWVADGIKALAPNGRNEDGTLNNKETTSKASVVIPTWVNVSPKGAPIGIGGNTGYVTYSALYYVESETEPASTYTIWYNPVRNEIFYKKSDGTIERTLWAVVGFYDATYGGVYANHLSLTNSNFKEAFRAVDYNDFNNLQNGIGSAKAYISNTYVNGTSGYRIWSDGYCEQWGTAKFSAQNTTVSLLKTFANTNYSLIHSNNRSAYLANWQANTVLISKATSSFVIGSSNTNGDGVCWRACGYLASGQY